MNVKLCLSFNIHDRAASVSISQARRLAQAGNQTVSKALAPATTAGRPDAAQDTRNRYSNSIGA
jgi:hypothetical protein